MLLTTFKMSDSAATSTATWILGCTEVIYLKVALANAGFEGPMISVPLDRRGPNSFLTVSAVRSRRVMGFGGK